VDELKETKPNLHSKSNLDNKMRHIIDAEPTAIVAIATIQPEEPEDPEDGEYLFHS
jgi:hypothetical protein